ncbi:MAG: 5-(carboxyamino)imidazole ribonucleotide synthase [Chloroflexi bacterium]|nr:MAG: 5-(carboxyamino)imidazole ribonucleotide synthase [Chloroflexota bacterium]
MHPVPLISQSPNLQSLVVGVFGSGQLGRMLALACHPLGIRVHTFSPERGTPTGQVCEREICAPYDDREAVRAFVRGVDAVTFELENVPSHVAEIAAEEGKAVRPGGHVLHVAQNRLREKGFFAEANLPVTPFAPVHSLADLQARLAELGTPAVVKTAAFGYDGKGQVKIDNPSQAADAWQAMKDQPAILEAFVPFEREVSVVAARGVDGSFAAFPLVENRHANHILDVTIAPAQVPAEVAAEAERLTKRLMEALDVVGVLCVEFFLLPERNQHKSIFSASSASYSDRLLLNEIAPRPHNSGHWTIEGAVTSQFEQQARAVCGLPLGSAEQIRPAVMVNLLGDLWAQGEPEWTALLAYPTAKLHLYGKSAARPGRKMGHVTVTAATAEEALEIALAARESLRGQ